jgi:hypothetical protein
MKTKRIMRATFVAILVTLSVLSGTTIWSNSLAFETCILSEGRCVSNGCTSAGGVCGMPEIEKGIAAAPDKCWCLF